MTYKEWKKQQDEEYGEGYVETERKKSYNYSKDKEQYARYVESLGKNAPKTFEDFQAIKYSNTNEYDLFKVYARNIKSGELTALADFELFKTIDAELENKVVGIVTSKGLEVKSKSMHSICRVIGSIEERRSGVEVADVIQALTSPDRFDSKTGKKGISDRYFGKNAIVTVNPVTQKLIQVNPRHRKKGA